MVENFKMLYRTIQLPEEFVIQEIDPLVNNKKLGYSSRANVVVDAVKRLSESLKGNEKKGLQNEKTE
jgi:Arc/MetJ-type ribon-helix-helix transcriptional regulator